MADRSGTHQRRSNSAVSTFLQSPILWGGAFTFSFYALIPNLPVHRELAERYFCGHPLEYATTYLFFVGISVLTFKLLGISAERAALRLPLFDGLADGESRAAGAQSLAERVRQVPYRFQQTAFVSRMQDVAAYLTQRQSHQSLEEHLRYLAERSADRLHASYALVRTVTWAVPILGFLGTVIGITMAIANISPSELQSSLTEVISGLSISFDTTALALTLSMFLVFGAFLTERLEQQILMDVEDLGMREIAGRFPGDGDASKRPLVAAEMQAAEELLQQSRELIAWQSKVWRQSLDDMRERWVETLGSQESELQESLSEMVQTTLNHHNESLAQVRSEFLDAFNSAARVLSAELSESRAARHDLHREFQEQMRELLEELRAEARQSQQHLDSRAHALLSQMTGQMDSWQKRLQEGTESVQDLMVEQRRQTDLLGRLLEQGGAMSSLSEELSTNLAALTAGNKLEEVLHNLNAAVHLLTARSLPRAA